MADLNVAFTGSTPGVLRLPDRLEEPGLLVGWSLDWDQRAVPFGFSSGNPQLRPETGWIDPIVMCREGHLLTIAPTGAGKGRGCIIPALLRHEGPVIVIDPKGENVAVTARHRERLGQQVVVLDPMGITGARPGAFNPLDLIEADSVEAVDLATAFATALVDGRDDVENAYWYQRAQYLLASLMLHVATEQEQARRSFGRIRDLLAEIVGERGLAEEGQLSGVSLEIARSPHPEARKVASLLQSGAREGLSSILSMAQNGVDFLRGPLIERATRRSDFPLYAVTRGDPLSIYIVLPPHMLESHGRLLRLWVMALLALITRRRGRPERSTLFILDEAAQLGPLPQLRQAITLLRGYGVQTWSFWQDASQLRLLYPQDWQTMVNNCAVIQCFGALNQSAADSMAELTGFGNGATVLGLNSFQMLLQMAGKPAVVARKPDYLNDPPFAGQFDANPFHDSGQRVVPPPAPRIALLPQPVIVQPDDRGLSALLDRTRPGWRGGNTSRGRPVTETSDSQPAGAAEGEPPKSDEELLTSLAKQIREHVVQHKLGQSETRVLIGRLQERLLRERRGIWMHRRAGEEGFPWYWNWPQFRELRQGGADWETCLPALVGDDKEAAAGLLGIEAEASSGIEFRRFDLPFYPGCFLLHAFDALGQREAFAIARPEDPKAAGSHMARLATLNGTSPPIHELNGKGRLDIAELPVQLDYLRFFCMMVQGEHGPFRLVEPTGKDEDHLRTLFGDHPEVAETGLANLPALRVARVGLDGRPQVKARVCYGPAFFDAEFAIDLSGMVEMLDDDVIAQLPQG